MKRLTRSIARLVRTGKRPEGHAHRLFELKTSLTPGGTATAYPRDKTTVPGTLTTDLTTEFEVEDDIGDREGEGRDDAGSGGRGAYGKALQVPGDDTWYVHDLECP